MTIGELTVVGTGYSPAGHATPETRSEIERADRVFYLLTDPVTALWVRQLNPAAESVHDCYREGLAGEQASREMVERILAPLGEGLKVCAVFYGHPGVFVRPAHEALRRARSAGHDARMLPAVSAADCLFADLGVDPGERGCQLFEATDFLVRRRRFEPRTPLILLQIGAIGVTSYREGRWAGRRGLEAMSEVLCESYPASHEVVLYENSQLPILEPRIERLAVGRLGAARVPVNATLFVPPLGPRLEIDPELLARVAPD